MILGIISDDYYPKEGGRWGGTGWARIAKYLPHLPASWDIHVASSVWPADEEGLSISTLTGTRVYPDVIWCQRVSMPNFAAHVMTARLVGQRVVTDLDDLLWELPKGSLADKAWSSDQILNFIQTLTLSDAVVCSTKWLASRLHTEFKIDSEVIPNTVDVDTFTPVHHNHGTPYLGWTGSPVTRGDDLDILAEVLPHFFKKYKVQHSGHVEGLPTFEDKTGVAPHRLLGSVHPLEVPDLLTFHVGTVPLTQTNFNRAKSDLKGIEYAAAGIPFVASSLPSYKQLRKEWGDVVRVARTIDDWKTHLTELLDFDTRRAEGEELRKLACRRSIGSVNKDLVNVLIG